MSDSLKDTQNHQQRGCPGSLERQQQLPGPTHPVIDEVRFGRPPCGARAAGEMQRGLGACYTTALLMQTSGCFASLLHAPGVLYFIGSIFPNRIVQKNHKLPEWCNSPVRSVGPIKQFTLVVRRALFLFNFFPPASVFR